MLQLITSHQRRELGISTGGHWFMMNLPSEAGDTRGVRIDTGIVIMKSHVGVNV